MIELQHPSRSYTPRLQVYGIAGNRLASDAPVPELETFGVGHRLRHDSERVIGTMPSGPGQRVFRGFVELGPRRYFLDCSWHDAAYELSVTGLGRFTIDRHGERITFEPDSEDLNGFSEIFLGPSLILALALHGVWCMHASAVAIDGKALVFLGTSGAGKSTLARALPTTSSGGFRCAADDVVPVRLDNVSLTTAGARALPRFPQLKYPPNRQPGADMPPSLPLGGIYILDTDDSNADGVVIEPIKGYEAVLTLVRHTHSARLFSQDLLRRHFDFCAQLVSRAPVRRLAYPKQREILPQVAEALRLEHATKATPVVAQPDTRAAMPNRRSGQSSCLERRPGPDLRGGSANLNINLQSNSPRAGGGRS